MREATIINEFNIIKNYVINLEDQLKIALSGEAIRAQALQNLLTKKGIFTEAELTEAIGEEIKRINNLQAEAAEKAKTELVKPTAEEVAKVTETASKAEEPVVPSDQK